MIENSTRSTKYLFSIGNYNFKESIENTSVNTLRLIITEKDKPENKEDLGVKFYNNDPCNRKVKKLSIKERTFYIDTENLKKQADKQKSKVTTTANQIIKELEIYQFGCSLLTKKKLAGLYKALADNKELVALAISRRPILFKEITNEIELVKTTNKLNNAIFHSNYVHILLQLTSAIERSEYCNDNIMDLCRISNTDLITPVIKKIIDPRKIKNISTIRLQEFATKIETLTTQERAFNVFMLLKAWTQEPREDDQGTLTFSFFPIEIIYLIAQKTLEIKWPTKEV